MAELSYAINYPPKTLADYKHTTLPREQRGALEYIETMASLLSINIQHWDLAQVFANPDGTLPVETAELNRKLLAQEALEKDQKRLDPSLEKELFAQIERSLQNASLVRHTELQNRLREIASDIDRRQRTLQTVFVTYHQIQLDLAKLRGENSSQRILQDLLAIAQNPFWILDSWIDGKLRLITRNDCILVYRQGEQIQYRVNLGQFKVMLDPITVEIGVFPWTNNLTSPLTPHYHPYIQSQTGAVCWGNAANLVKGLRLKRDIKGVFEILQSLLMNYSAGTTPWETLDVFQILTNRALPPEERRNVPGFCNHCLHYRDECTCREGPMATDGTRTPPPPRSCDVCDEECDDDGLCQDHWCSICQTNTDDCGCCGTCENIEGACTCCSICGCSNSGDCLCCHECGSRDDDCRRCRECDRHPREGRENQHFGECSQAPVLGSNEPTPTASAEANPRGDVE